MGLVETLQVIVTSADGTQTRSLPRVNILEPSWRIVRFGGYGDATIPTNLPFDGAKAQAILKGDRVRIYAGGTLQYEGYVTGKLFSTGSPDRYSLSCYGASLFLQGVPCNQTFAFPYGSVDVAQAFREFAQVYLLGATGPQGNRLIDYIQALPIGVDFFGDLDATDKTAKDVLDALAQQAGNLAVWGVDTDPNGWRRLYFRPFASVSGLAALFCTLRLFESGDCCAICVAIV